VTFCASRARVIVVRVLLRPERGEAIASVLFAFTATGLIALLYNLNPFNSWALLVGVWASSEALILYLLQNQRGNEKKFRKHPVSFPNPEGCGILGEYVNRPWQNELAELRSEERRVGEAG